jgi:hypothetical protein
MNVIRFPTALFYLLTGLLFCLPTQASPWSDLEPGTLVKLNRNLDLGNGIVLAQNSRLAVNHREFIGPPHIEILTLRLFPCDDPLASTKIPMQILEDTYGIEMGQGCQISMYLEVRDYYKESYFEIETR